MLWYRLVIDPELDEDEVRFPRDVQGKAEREVVRADRYNVSYVL
jgi:hypothetical protein